MTGTCLVTLKPAATLSAATKLLLAEAVETLHSSVKRTAGFTCVLAETEARSSLQPLSKSSLSVPFPRIVL